MYSKKEKLLFFIAVTSLFATGYLAVKLQLCREANHGAGYLIDLTIAKERISPGMSYEEVVNRVHHQPDEIENRQDGTLICRWSASHHYGTFERLFGYVYENGHRWLVVVFNSGKVERIELQEG